MPRILIVLTLWGAFPVLAAGKTGPCRSAEACAARCEAKHLPSCVHAAQSAAKSKSTASSLGFYEQACALADPQSCWISGLSAWEGTSGRVDETLAFSRFQQSCDAGYEVACSDVGLAHASGGGTPVNVLLAQLYLAKGLKATEADCRTHGRSCWILGQAEWQGLLPGGAKAADAHFKKAVPLLTKECAAGSASGCHKVALLRLFGQGVKSDVPQALRDVQRGCELGSARSCHAWAEWLVQGVGGPVDLARAMGLYARACEQQWGWSCERWAWWLRQGEGVPRDEERSNTLFAQAAAFLGPACEGGHGAACFLLGQWARTGVLKVSSPEKSESWFQRAASFQRAACERKEGEACRLLGIQYQQGLGVKVSLKRGLALEERACREDSALACQSLAERYVTGQWRMLHPGRSLPYWWRACQLGLSSACDRAKEVAKMPAPKVPVPAAAACTGGRVPDEDASGKCCWPEQLWSGKENRCVGPPSCPAGKIEQAEDCTCSDGRSATAEGACCWPGQKFLPTLGCTGPATGCPETHFLRSGTCELLPSCPEGKVATQATAGHCCWPGQKWDNACQGQPTACGKDQTASGNDCVASLEKVLDGVAQGVRLAVRITAPDGSSAQQVASTLQWVSGSGCKVSLREEEEVFPLKGGVGPVRTTKDSQLDLARITSVTVRPAPDGLGRSGSEFLLSVHVPVTTRTRTQRFEWDEATQRMVLSTESQDEAGSSSWGRLVSLPGGASEAARALALAARGCGANPLLDAGPGGEATQEQRELSRRAMSQSRLRAEALAQLGTAGRPISSEPSVADEAAAVAMTAPPLPSRLAPKATETALAVSTAPPKMDAPKTFSARVSGSELPAVSSELAAACPTCLELRCASSVAACKMGTPAACAEAAACLCECQLSLGNCGSDEGGLSQCVSHNRREVMRRKELGGCEAPAGQACWYSPPGKACPVYPSLQKCTAKHKGCSMRVGLAGVSC